MVTVLRVANFVLLAINILLFALWFSLIRKDALPANGEASEYVLSHLTLQITLLGVILTVGVLAFGALAFFGLQAVIERSEAQAERIARDVIATRLDDMFGNSTRPVHRQSVSRRAPLPDPGDVTEENG
jgi:hypothetical protein